MSRARFRFAQKVFLFNTKGRLLLVRFSKNERLPKELHGTWDLPGGGLEASESLSEGLEREVREELGNVKFEIGKPLVVGDWYQEDDAKTRTICVFYLGKFLRGEIILNEEHDEFSWLSIGEAKKLPYIKKDEKLVKRLFEVLERAV